MRLIGEYSLLWDLRLDVIWWFLLVSPDFLLVFQSVFQLVRIPYLLLILKRPFCTGIISVFLHKSSSAVSCISLKRLEVPLGTKLHS